MERVNVLSLDGGGSRGVVSAVLLAALAERVPGFLERIDLFAGTSIGAANAVAVAAGHSPRGMVNFYPEHGHQLFSERLRPKGLLGLAARILEHVPGLGPEVDDADALFLPKWSNRGLERALADYFGAERRLGDLDPRRVLMLALELSGRLPDSPARVVLPVCIRNFGPGSERFRERPIHELLLGAMAAPTFFESAGGFVDGGVFANNPSVAALVSAAELVDRRLERVRLLSIGTGICPDAIESDGPLRWGVIKWGEHFPEVSLRAVSEFDHLRCQALLGEGYHRLNVTLPENFAMDDYRAIPRLRAVAERAVETPAFRLALEFVEASFG